MSRFCLLGWGARLLKIRRNCCRLALVWWCTSGFTDERNPAAATLTALKRYQHILKQGPRIAVIFDSQDASFVVVTHTFNSDIKI